MNSTGASADGIFVETNRYFENMNKDDCFSNCSTVRWTQTISIAKDFSRCYCYDGNSDEILSIQRHPGWKMLHMYFSSYTCK